MAKQPTTTTRQALMDENAKPISAVTLSKHSDTHSTSDFHSLLSTFSDCLPKDIVTLILNQTPAHPRMLALPVRALVYNIVRQSKLAQQPIHDPTTPR
jgi:hypothetical protein